MGCGNCLARMNPGQENLYLFRLALKVLTFFFFLQKYDLYLLIGRIDYFAEKSHKLAIILRLSVTCLGWLYKSQDKWDNVAFIIQLAELNHQKKYIKKKRDYSFNKTGLVKMDDQ